LTVTLAVGVHRMAQRNAIVRSLPAVETLGSTTVIASDKTGTLTQNEMTVRAIVAGGTRYGVTGVGSNGVGAIVRGNEPARVAENRPLLATLHTGVLASEGEAGASTTALVGDPVEKALLVAAAKGGIQPNALHVAHPETDQLPFEPERGFMISVRETGEHHVAHLKGAPEVVIARCDWQLGNEGETPIDRAAALADAAALAREGLRVLAMAYRREAGSSLTRDSVGSGFVLAGLVGMTDPLRADATRAVADARNAGIRVLMLTGDHADTARVVGRALDLGERVIVGSELDRMTDDALDRALTEAGVFARVAPDHKLRIVRRLQARGDVVAVTGDGVNDAPALRAAHIGIAMGKRGSDAARDAADIVLTDDSFSTITSAVEQGRVVFANLRKATFFLLSTAAGEVLAILTALLAGWPLPFTAAQILWINLVTDSVEDVALAFEPAEPNLLDKAPRKRSEGMLTPRLTSRLVLVGVVIAAATLGVFWWTYATTGDLDVARTAAVTQMVVLQFYHTFNCRSLTRSLRRVRFFSNPFLLVSMIAVALLHGAALNLMPLQRLLHLMPLNAHQLLVILVVGLSVVAGAEADKWISRRQLEARFA
jgi:Ca2+-transporting ATPase